jgi:sensor histidine kinase YesM
LLIVLGLLLAFKGDVGLFYAERKSALQEAILLADIFTFVFIIGCIYLLIFILIPRLLFRSRVFLFALSFLVLVIIIYLQVWFVDFYFLKPADNGSVSSVQHIEFSFVSFIQLAAVTTILLSSVIGFAIFKKWINDTRQMNELYRANMRAELEQLKSQVNPHFLFNTLNNLYVLSKTDPEKASQVILGLSDLLRYQLYDSASEKVVLSKEINFLRNLLALEKLRKNDFDFTVNTEGRTDGITVSPFLFIPFVENAIKHGASATGHSYLWVDFSIKEKSLHFRSENSIPFVKKNAIGGLGLKNITRRLELLYPETYTLEIKADTEKYIVNLIIPL